MKINLRTTLAAALLTPALALAQAEQPLGMLQAESVHPKTLSEVVTSLTRGHYNKVALDDQLSSDMLNSYLSALDPSRSYFYTVDIDEFEALRSQLDDEIKAKKLDSGYRIYNRYQQRLQERLEFAIERLESDQSFDFGLEESLETDRENAAWIVSREEMNNLWRKRIKSALLNLMLAEKTESEARETLIKRYKNQLKRAHQTNSEDVFQVYLNTLTGQFDPHTSYFSPRNSENFQINMSLSLEGIGAVLQSENEYTKIVRLVPAGPADKTGQIKAADRIIGVGQGETGEIEDVVGWRLDDVVQKIRGPKGTTVRLQIIPSDGDEQGRKIVSIKRNTVKLEEQAAQKRVLEIPLDGETYKIGVIEIPTFYIDFAALQRGDKDYKSTTRDVEKLIAELEQEDKINGLIIDLRNNGGGSLREANELVGLFIDRGPTVQIRNPGGRIDILGDFNPKIAYRGPVAVVINRLSASASEIFAGAIQDYRRGIVLGNQTFGKGTVQTLQPLNHGQLKLTHAKFYRISGESTQNKGVVPDITFPSLYDKSDIGESSLDKALPWDTVKKARHAEYLGPQPFLDELQRRHQHRANNQPDFIFMREQVDYVQSLKEDTLVPLNRQLLEDKRASAEQWQVDAENRRRSAKGEKMISDLDQLDELAEKDPQGRPIAPESEAILEESAHILLDLMELTVQYSAARQQNQ